MNSNGRWFKLSKYFKGGHFDTYVFIPIGYKVVCWDNILSRFGDGTCGGACYGWTTYARRVMAPIGKSRFKLNRWELRKIKKVSK